MKYFPRPEVRLYFAWYDWSIGAYWNQRRRTLYLTLVPMVVLSLHFLKREAA